MKRTDIISKIGRKYLKSNIENDEFSYKKGLEKIGKNYLVTYLKMLKECIKICNKLKMTNYQFWLRLNKI